MAAPRRWAGAGALTLLLLVLAAAASDDGACAVFGGPVPDEATQGLTPWSLFFLAVADMAYDHDFGLGRLSPRRPTGPCLQAWGAAEPPVHLNATSLNGGEIHAYVFRSRFDVFVSFRGLASMRDVRAVDADTDPFRVVVEGSGATSIDVSTKEHTAALFAPSAAEAAKGQGLPDDFWVLDGFALAYLALAPHLVAEIRAQAAKLPAERQDGWRLWITGHSDGAQYSQLAGFHLSTVFGRHRIGGVLLWGPCRVGNVAFADFYNGPMGLGNKTMRVSFGRDPASEEMYTVQQGLKMVGLGIAMCPYPTPHPGQALEQLVVLPIGTDRMNVCAELPVPSWPGRLGALLGRAFGQTGLSPASGSGSGNRALGGLSSIEYMAHHIPNTVFDAVDRQLAAAGDAQRHVSACQRKALELPQCVVSDKCSSAIRPPKSARKQCASCGSAAACQAFWPGAQCDTHSAVASSWLCHPGHAPPPTVLGLLTLPSRV